MIDIENKVFDTVSKALEKAFKGISVSSINTDKPATFPYVSIVETSNSVDPAFSILPLSMYETGLEMRNALDNIIKEVFK